MSQSFPPLTESQRQLLQEGVRRFNLQEFFECHEVLEAAWLQASGDQKRFLQGLIQVAVAFHHLRRGNLVGASRLLSAGMEKLSGFAPRQEAVDVGLLLEHLGPLQEKIRIGDVPPDCPVPQVCWKPDVSSPEAPSAD